MTQKALTLKKAYAMNAAPMSAVTITTLDDTPPPGRCRPHFGHVSAFAATVWPHALHAFMVST
jgi:hypothetical protein